MSETLDSVTITKIVNGFLISQSGYITGEDNKEKWSEHKWFYPTLEEVSIKLKEIFNA